MQVYRDAHLIEEAGLRLAMIGNGLPAMIDEFRRRLDIDVDIYTDPSRRSFRALGFHRSIRRALSLAPMPTALSAYRKGLRQRRTAGDPWQMGGVVVVSAKGEQLFRYASQHASDYPEPRTVLSALDPRDLRSDKQG